MKVLFDGVQVNGDYIVGLHQSAGLFENGSFSLGSTVCRTVTLQVLKEGVTALPQVVNITTDDDIVLFTLYVDQIEELNSFTYEITLVDDMVSLNKEYE